MAVHEVADVLTSLSPDNDDHHRMFLESHVRVLVLAVNHSKIFGTMNFDWNYLDPSLLRHLVKYFYLEEVKGEMEAYNTDVLQFGIKTPLTFILSGTEEKKDQTLTRFPRDGGRV